MNDLNKIRKYVFIRCPDRTTGWWNSRISGLTGWKPGNYQGNWDHSMRILTSDVSTDGPSADGCLRPWLGQGKLSLSICWCWCVWFIECIGSTQTFHSMSWLCCLGRELNNYVIDRKNRTRGSHAGYNNGRVRHLWFSLLYNLWRWMIKLSDKFFFVRSWIRLADLVYCCEN